MKETVKSSTSPRGAGTHIGACIFVVLSMSAGVALGQTGAPRACDLLAESDVHAVLGAGYARMEPQLGRETCAYRKPPSAMVVIIVTSASDGAETTLRGRRGMFKATITPAPEVGREAFFASGNKGTALHFGKEKWVAQLEASAAANDPKLLQQLARKALARQ